MNTSVPILAPSRFKEARERAGLTVAAIARDLGITSDGVWDLEMHEDEWRTCLSPVQLARFCRVTGALVSDLFGGAVDDTVLAPGMLARQIREHCQHLNLSVSAFEEQVGWGLDGLADDPTRMLRQIPVDGLISISDELGVDWRRVLRGL